MTYFSFNNNYNDLISGGEARNYGGILADGRLGKSLELDGTNYVRFPTNIGDVTGDISLSVWIYRSGSTAGGVVVHKGNQYSLIISSAGAVSWADSSLWRYASFGYYGSIPADSWHHIAVTKKSSNIIIYLDNNVLVNKTFGSSIRTDTSSAFAGCYGGNSGGAYCTAGYFKGKIDDLALFNKALSAEEVSEIYNSGNGKEVCTKQEICNENWQCLDWSTCLSNQRTRICSDLNNCKTINNKPIENQGCEIPVCNENWQCSDWSTCSDNNQIRDCTDLSECRTINNKPSTIQNCTVLNYCYDSDEGLNYFKKGYLTTSVSPGTNFEDYCLDFNKLIERHCLSENPRNFTVEYSCANGCRDGKCLVAPIGKCDNLITKIKKSEDYKFQDIDFKSTWSGSYEFDEWWGDESHNGIAYQSSWNAYSEGKSYYLDYNVIVFNEENVDLNEWLKQRTSYQVCQITSHWNEDKENYYYICNWDVLRNEQNTNNYNYQTRQIFWVNKNIAAQVYVYTGKYLSDEEVLMISQKRLNDVLSSFINNEMKYISWENFDFDWLLRGQIIDNFEDCPSEVKLFVNNETNSTCWPSWNCKIEPVICPPHGFQKKTCIDYSCNQEIREEQIYCSPGICSGCVVPRWLDSKGDNKCIPYGFRFEQLVGWESKLIEDTGEDSLKEGEYGDVSLKVLSDKEAVLTLYGRDGKAYDYTLVLGESVEIIIPGWDEDIDSIKLYVKKIFYSEDSAISSYIEFSATVSGWQKVEKTINAYCDIDGEVKQQKGDWDKCMNSYECDSNLCSGRECTAINAMIKEVSGYKTLGVKVLCKIADVFGIEDYYVCLTGYLGDDYLKTSSSSSGGAGGGSSGSSSSK